MPIETMRTTIVARALISGVRPRRILEKIYIGSVVEFGPATKLARTTSSSDNVKAKSHAETKDGVMMGRVI